MGARLLQLLDNLVQSLDIVNSLCVAAQLSSAKTKKLAKELQELHNAAFQAVKDQKEVLARRLLEVSLFKSAAFSSCIMHACMQLQKCNAPLASLVVHI